MWKTSELWIKGNQWAAQWSLSPENHLLPSLAVCCLHHFPQILPPFPLRPPVWPLGIMQLKGSGAEWEGHKGKVFYLFLGNVTNFLICCLISSNSFLIQDVELSGCFYISKSQSLFLLLGNSTVSYVCWWAKISKIIILSLYLFLKEPMLFLFCY